MITKKYIFHKFITKDIYNWIVTYKVRCIKMDIYKIGKNLGLNREDIDNVVASREKSSESPCADTYKAGTDYATVSPKEIYKAGTSYGTVSPKELYKAGTSYATISPKDLYKAGTSYATISPKDLYKAGTSYATISPKDLL